MVGWGDGSFSEGTAQKVCLLFNNGQSGNEKSHFGQVTCQASWIYYFCIYRRSTQEQWALSNSWPLQTFPSIDGKVGKEVAESELGGGGYPPRGLIRLGAANPGPHRPTAGGAGDLSAQRRTARPSAAALIPTAGDPAQAARPREGWG